MSARTGASLVEVAASAVILTLGILMVNRGMPGHDASAVRELSTQAEALRQQRDPRAEPAASGAVGVHLVASTAGAKTRMQTFELESHPANGSPARLTMSTLRAVDRGLDAKIGL